MEENVAQAAVTIDETSAQYLGKWNRLVSTTNWEKGRIVCQWRAELIQSGLPVSSYGDEAWSRYVGSVSPQHVGRLRRTFERFADTVPQFPGLYWSHFQAALDWPDAEMYLEGAVQNRWSVSQMRRQRWEATGALAAEEPADNDAPAAEYDEDSAPFEGGKDSNTLVGETVEVCDPESHGGDFDHLSASDEGEDFSAADQPAEIHEEPAVTPAVRPFANMPALPADLSDAFERFKLTILNHKVTGWQEISRDQILAVLEGLKEMVLAP